MHRQIPTQMKSSMYVHQMDMRAVRLLCMAHSIDRSALALAVSLPIQP